MFEKSCKNCKHLNFVDYCDFIHVELMDFDFANKCDGYDAKVAQKDPVNPSHYTQGKIECIDALESATINKKGIEAVCVANVIKYLWRYEEKNGLEDVKKCQWYLNRLLEVLEDNDQQ